MADHYRYWFKTGFVACCVSILAVIIDILGRKSNYCTFGAKIVQAMCLVFSIFWFFWCGVLRFSDAGRVASGEFYKENIKDIDDDIKIELDNEKYMASSGIFLTVYFYGSLCVFAIAITACCGGS